MIAAVTPESQTAIIVGSFAALSVVMSGVGAVVAWWMNRISAREVEAREQRAAAAAVEREERLAKRTEEAAEKVAAELVHTTKDAKSAAEKVASVLVENKNDVKQSTTEVKTALASIEHKVNTALGVQLRRVAELSREKANDKPTAANKAAAAADEQAHRDHEAGQGSPTPRDVKADTPDPIEVIIKNPNPVNVKVKE